MKRLTTWIIWSITALGLGLGISLALHTDRLYTHFFYIPIALTAVRYPPLTWAVGIVFAGIHLIVELVRSGEVGLIVWVRAGVIIAVTLTLRGIWRNEQQLNQRIHRLDYERYHDGLTGCENRSAFEGVVLEALRYPVAIFVADVDGLKIINDNYGHIVGDRYIVAASRVLQMDVRAIDRLFRMGGDEFVALVEGCNQEGALQVYQRVEREMAAYNAKSSPVDMPVPLSVSLGLEVVNGAEDFRDALAAADRNMYCQKKSKKTNPQ